MTTQAQAITQLSAATIQLQNQQALTVQIIRAFAENRMDGPNSVKWLMAALSPNDAPLEVVPFVVDQ